MKRIIRKTIFWTAVLGAFATGVIGQDWFSRTYVEVTPEK